MILTKLLYLILTLLLIADILFIGVNAFLPPILTITHTLGLLITATVICACTLIYREKQSGQ